MIVVWGSVITTADRVDELLALSLEHVHRSRREDGCVEHGAYVDAEDGTRVVFFEKWADEASLRRHFAVPASADFLRRASALASAPPRIEIYHAEPIPL